MAATVAVLLLAAAFRLDLSAARDFRNDALVRYAFSAEERVVPRYHDQSPFTIWLPSDWLVWDSLRGGQLPTWERLQGGGYSPVVNLYGGVFHPARWLAAAFPRTAMPTVLILEALALAAFGWYCLARHCGYPSPLATCGAALFTLSAPMISYAHFSGSILPLAHLPWILLILRILLRRPTVGCFALLAFSIALMLMAGHPLIAFGAAIVAASYAIGLCIEEKSPRPLLYLGAAGLLALPLGAFFLLPPILSVPDLWSYKTSSAAGQAFQVLPLADWIEAFSYVLYDSFTPGEYVDRERYYAHVGLAAAFLAAVALVFAIRTPGRRLPTVLAALWFLVLVPGPWMTPMAAVPPFGYLKSWYYASGFALFLPFAMVDGLAVLSRQTRAVRVVGMLVMGVALVTVSVRAYLVLWPEPWSPIVKGPLVERLRDGSRTMGLWGHVNLPNTARITGIEDVRQSHPMFSRRAHIWWRLVDPGIERRAYPTTRVTDRLTSPLVGAFQVRYVIQDRQPPTGTSTTDLLQSRRDRHLSRRVARFPLLYRTPTAEVRSIPGPIRPRAYFAETVTPVRTLEEAEALLRRDPAIVTRGAVVEGEGGAFPTRASGQARVHHPSDSRVTIETDSPTGGLLVLNDAFARGWTATVAGRATPVHPVNVIARGVRVQPGKQRVEMRYSPPGMRLGVAITAVTALVLFALARRVR